jgi:hypothetical protein
MINGIIYKEEKKQEFNTLSFFLMIYSCPISLNRSDSTIARLNAFYITILLIVFFFTQTLFFLTVILLEYFFKIKNCGQFAPISALSLLTQKIFKLPKKLIDDEPKKFARYLGFAMSIILLIFSLNNLSIGVIIINIIFLFCTTLEASIDYCIGCKFYNLLFSK